MRAARPAYVPRGARYVPSHGRVYAPRRWVRVAVIVTLLLAGAVLVGLFVSAWPDAHAPHGRFVTPATYGPPGPTGGPA